MTLHLSMEYICSKCEAKYIPYNETIVCPKCGNKEDLEKYPKLVEGICDSFVFNIKSTKRFDNCWVTFDISDMIQSIFFYIFNTWALDKMENYEPENRTEEFKKHLEEVIDKIDFHEDTYIKDYLKKLGMEVYEEFFNVRKYKLKVNKKNIILQEGE